MFKYIREWWQQYRYRFVPWIVFNLKDRRVRKVDKGQSDKVLSEEEVDKYLRRLFSCLDDYPQPQNIFKERHTSQVSHKVSAQNAPKHSGNYKPNTLDDYAIRRKQLAYAKRYRENLQKMKNYFGFKIERRKSLLANGGTGVFVTEGKAMKGTVVGLYPGLMYHPGEPVFIQSLQNPFIFRCVDGILLDGNDKGVSKYLFKSCSGRDRIGPYRSSDISWLTSYPRNPLAVGQYVNNASSLFPANVVYQEFNLPKEFPLSFMKYIPNGRYEGISEESHQKLLRLVVLISLRDIHEGEELLSSYYTMIN